ncbi:MAG TPA: hypothetical protein VEG61_06330 [Candidatus Dormibacteraeota bacterium]|nr:hypothetical protein [Candidatus Dormibacteraeota bacterium]
MTARNAGAKERYVPIPGSFYAAQNATQREQLAKTAPTATGKVRRNVRHAAEREKHDDALQLLLAFYKF